MSQQESQSKPSGYININTELNMLQRVMCCNHNIGNTPADTPRNKPQKQADFSTPVDDEIQVEIQEKISPNV